jgi:type I restriction enzyme S subunit
MRIRVDLEKINPFFCCFSLYGSPIVLRQIADSCGGSTRNFIDGKILKTLEIPLPPLSEQHEIVRRVDALFARADAAEREVAAATKRAEALTQVVLVRAFSGKL